jgi:hypothetical protein
MTSVNRVRRSSFWPSEFELEFRTIASTLSKVVRICSVGPPARDGAGIKMQKNNNKRPTAAIPYCRTIPSAILALNFDIISFPWIFPYRAANVGSAGQLKRGIACRVIRSQDQVAAGRAQKTPGESEIKYPKSCANVCIIATNQIDQAHGFHAHCTLRVNHQALLMFILRSLARYCCLILHNSEKNLSRSPQAGTALSAFGLARGGVLSIPSVSLVKRGEMPYYVWEIL